MRYAFIKRLRIISAPFEPLTMPSVDVATLKACLNEKGVPVEVDVLCPKYAVYIGDEQYSLLLNSILGDAVFSALLYPSNVPALKQMLAEDGQFEAVDFDGLVDRTKQFFLTYVGQIRYTAGDLIFLYVYKSQLFPALYIAKLIYQSYKLPVWMAGYHCSGICGESLLHLFPFVERVFGQDIECSVINAVLGSDPYVHLELNDFPTPDYSDYINSLDFLPEPVRQKLAPNLWLQVEFSRGCWWNQCSFCTFHCPYSGFQPKSIDNIIRDYKALQSRYKSTQILVTEFNSDHNWRALVTRLNDEFPGLHGTYYLLFKVSALQNEDDWRFLKENDIPILVGVESFSAQSLVLMNKSQTVIKSIQLIKYAERYGVKCCYNLMCGLPFETEDDFLETERIVSYIKHCLPPFHLEVFRLTNGSLIQQSPEKYCIKRMGIRKDIEGILIPPELHDEYAPFFLDFESTIPGLKERGDRWLALIQEWIDIYYGYAKAGRPKLHSLLYLRNNAEVLDVYDGRDGAGYVVRSLTGLSRSIYEFCDQIRSLSEIEKEYAAYSDQELLSILDAFVNDKLMFKEDANYLSLAV